MAKVNQAQEPSMEEILASIRRIISDDGDDAPLPGRNPASISTEAIDALFGPRGEDSDPIPSFLRQEPAAGAPRPVRQEPRADQPVARFEQPAMRPEPRVAAEQRQTAEPKYAAESKHSSDPKPFAELKPRIEMGRTEPARPEPATKVEAPRAEPVQRATPPPQAHAPFPEADAVQPRPAAAIVPVEELPAGQPLLSAAADAAVSASFGGLASTLLSANARTLEDLVKDMLRPMLKAWLDSNLPPLVERLVRDEIERVSRGR